LLVVVVRLFRYWVRCLFTFILLRCCFVDSICCCSLNVVVILVVVVHCCLLLLISFVTFALLLLLVWFAFLPVCSSGFVAVSSPRYPVRVCLRFIYRSFTTIYVYLADVGLVRALSVPLRCTT